MTAFVRITDFIVATRAVLLIAIYVNFTLCTRMVATSYYQLFNKSTH